MDFLKDLLGEELFAQVSEKLQGSTVRLVNAADGSFVPKERLDEQRTAAKDYKRQIDELNGKLSAMQGDAATLNDVRAEVERLKQTVEAKENEIARNRLSYRIKDEVRGSKAKNADVILKMIDLSKVIEQDDKLVGLSEQIDALKTSDAYLFEQETPQRGGFPSNFEPTPQSVNTNMEMNSMIRTAAGR